MSSRSAATGRAPPLPGHRVIAFWWRTPTASECSMSAFSHGWSSRRRPSRRDRGWAGLIAAGNRLTDTTMSWELDFGVRGLAVGSSGRLWAGRDGGVVGLDWDGQQQLDTVAVPGLMRLIS